MYRKTYVEIDLDTLKENIKTIINTYKGYKYYFGVVKNNAYSHGFYAIKAMLESGINYLAVSSLEEALTIRKMYKDTPILILEPISFEGVKIASENDITIMIDDRDYFDRLKKEDIRIKFHLKIDTGMNRFGLKDKDAINHIYREANPHQYLEGIYTHLSYGNENSNGFKKQTECFRSLVSDIDLKKIEIVHLDRSLTLEQHEKIKEANGVRLGIIMYGIAYQGYTPSLKRKIFNFLTFKKTKIIEPKLHLKTVFTFKTHVMEIKEIKRHDIVGYGGMYEATKDTKIAILPYGFADYLYDNKGEVSINNKYYKVIAINMDVTIIEVDDNVHVDDEVEIFGGHISLRKKSNEIGENIYKLLTSVTFRVPRVYIEDGKREEIQY